MGLLATSVSVVCFGCDQQLDRADTMNSVGAREQTHEIYKYKNMNDCECAHNGCEPDASFRS